LYGLHVKAGFFTEKSLAKYIANLGKALLYCQAKNIIHCDIKLENIILESLNEIRIADFGFLSTHPPVNKGNAPETQYVCKLKSCLKVQVGELGVSAEAIQNDCWFGDY
jgi:serine/threonine protein kinase